MPGRIGVVGLEEGGLLPVLSGEDVDSNAVINLDELAGAVDETVAGEIELLIVTVKKVEGLDDQVEFEFVSQMDAAGQAQVRRGVVGAEE